MRFIGLLAVLVFLASGTASARPLPACSDAETAGLRSLRDDERQGHGGHALSPLTYAEGATPQNFGFVASYVIGVDGRVSCLSLEGIGAGVQRPLDMTPQRQAFADALAASTFTPFMTDGQLARVYVASVIAEQEAPRLHVTPPDDEARTLSIHLESHGRRSGDGPYRLTIAGDGTVTFVPGPFDRAYFLGPQTYTISPEAVAGMLDLANGADFWSLRDAYVPDVPEPMTAMVSGADATYDHIDISLGGRRKSLDIYPVDTAGAPLPSRRLMQDMASLAKIGLWRDLNGDTVAQLAQTHFAFRSKRGGQLLLEVAGDRHIPDALVEDLIRRGAPQNVIDPGYGLPETRLLDAMIEGRRAAMASRLIDKGALLHAGKPDARRVTRALLGAVKTSMPRIVAKLLAFSPALSVKADGSPCGHDDKTGCTPLITQVGGDDIGEWAAEDGDAPDDMITVTMQLLAAGADQNSVDRSGHRLIENAIEDDRPKFVAWLLDQGVTLRPDDLDLSLEREPSDDLTFLLLQSGAKIDEATRVHLIQAASDDDLPKVRIWLRAHGKWPPA